MARSTGQRRRTARARPRASTIATLAPLIRYPDDVPGDAAERKNLDLESFLALERGAAEKHELWSGQAYAMAGASFVHNQIVANLVGELRARLRGLACQALPSDLRVFVPTKNGIVYPDTTILCGERVLRDGSADVLLNPTVIVEVLSPDTEKFDRGEKFEGYRSIPSVAEVVLVAQHTRRVEHFARQPDGSWLLRVYRDSERCPLPAPGIELPLDEIYAGVELTD